MRTRTTILVALAAAFLCAGATTQLTLTSLIDDHVIRRAVEGTGVGSPSADGFLNSTGYDARRAITTAAFKRLDATNERLGERSYAYWSAYFRVNDLVIGTGRKALSTPEGIRAMEKALGPMIIRELHFVGQNASYKASLQEILPVFTGTLPPAYAQRLAAMERDWKPYGANLIAWHGSYQYSGKYDALLKQHRVSNEHFQTYEWILRRRKEGGQPVVDAWAGVIQRTIGKL